MLDPRWSYIAFRITASRALSFIISGPLTALVGCCIFFAGGNARAEDPIDSRALFREYLEQPSPSNSKYAGQTITVRGRTLRIDRFDLGLEHPRRALLEGGVRGLEDGVLLCFAESCSSFRHLTTTGSFYTNYNVGDMMTARCRVEPAASKTPDRVMAVQLSRCEILEIDAAATSPASGVKE